MKPAPYNITPLFVETFARETFANVQPDILKFREINFRE